MHRIDQRLRKIVHVMHRPLADQILRTIRELREEVAQEMRGIIATGAWRCLTDTRTRNLGDIVVTITVKERGDYFNLHVDWPSNGGRSLLNALLVGENIATGAFSPRDNDYGKYLTCCVDGPDRGLVGEYRRLKSATR